MATKPKNPSYVSPKGTFKWPSLTSPDYGSKEHPTPEGLFKTTVICDMTSEVQAFIDKLMPLWQRAIAEGREAYAKLPIAQRKKLGELKEQMFYEEEFDEATEEPTGRVIFKAKTKYKIKDKDTGDIRLNTISLFDAAGKPFPKGKAIYGGSEGKISFTVKPYWVAGQVMAGLSFYLNGAQIIKLVGPGERSAASLGFGAEEGYTAAEDQGGFDDESAGASDDDDSGANGNPQDF